MTGETSTAGWSDPLLELTGARKFIDDGIVDFRLVAEPPSGVAAEVLTPIEVTQVIDGLRPDLKGISVESETNEETGFLAKGSS